MRLSLQERRGDLGPRFRGGNSRIPGVSPLLFLLIRESGSDGAASLQPIRFGRPPSARLPPFSRTPVLSHAYSTPTLFPRYQKGGYAHACRISIRSADRQRKCTGTRRRLDKGRGRHSCAAKARVPAAENPYMGAGKLVDRIERTKNKTEKINQLWKFLIHLK